MSLTTRMDHCLPKVNLLNGLRWRARCAVWLMMIMAAGGAARALSADAAKAEPKERVVAKVNGMPIFASDLHAMITAQERALRSQLVNDPARLAKEMAEMKRNALNGLIDLQLLEDEFFRLGGVISKEDIEADVAQATQESFKGDREALMAEINAVGLTYDKYRELRERVIIVGAVRARMVNDVDVTDKMAREYYEKNLRRWRNPESVKLHTLTISKTTANARTVAESLRTRLVHGADFAVMAREESQDSRADEGGAWPWTQLSDINDEVGLAIAKTKKGKLSEVLEQAGTFIILRVDDRRDSEAKPFQSVKDEVRKSLMEELGRVRMENRLCRLREAADIQKLGPV